MTLPSGAVTFLVTDIGSLYRESLGVARAIRDPGRASLALLNLAYREGAVALAEGD